MLELLAAYSLQEIVVFVIMLLFAIKGGLDLFDYFKGKYNERFNKAYSKLIKEQELEQHYLKYNEFHKESMERYDKLGKKIDDLIYVFDDRFKKIEDSIDILLASDKDDIKSWLVEKYNYYKENPDRPISHHTMDTIEKRYAHYADEGGNSYITNIIMPELRQMAKERNKDV